MDHIFPEELVKRIMDAARKENTRCPLSINAFERKLETSENISTSEKDVKRIKKRKSNYMSDIMNKYKRGSNEKL